jgi:hypothetical protein
MGWAQLPLRPLRRRIDPFPPAEICIVLQELEHVPTLPTIRLGLRLILLTLVRKSELLDAV